MSQGGQNLSEFKRVAQNFIKKIIKKGPHKNKATVIGLYGNLGAGKTTFSQEVARVLGIKERVISPTFVILKKFIILKSRFKNLIHIDAYRLKNEKELENLGWSDLVKDPQNLILIEWPENVHKILPKNHICVYLEHVSEHERGIKINI